MLKEVMEVKWKLSRFYREGERRNGRDCLIANVEISDDGGQRGMRISNLRGWNVEISDDGGRRGMRISNLRGWLVMEQINHRRRWNIDRP
ncbi:hypothetical protein L2E82_30780 [Cichorium intybus]|uniref:Uncharacterized protein n=1 Tax=Cichorium intybus TaxID=13427 RepID=A0ACB9D215_CICIN|nr:hypothetical protein L2E82_30780 [Cichorium intybus]